jgi:hypothetical protein
MVNGFDARPTRVRTTAATLGVDLTSAQVLEIAAEISLDMPRSDVRRDIRDALVRRGFDPREIGPTLHPSNLERPEG